MSNFPTVKAKDFIKVIGHLGFYLDRQKGCRHFPYNRAGSSFNTFSVPCSSCRHNHLCFSKYNIAP
jgi:predicted RNA binding protein YcfA (HicA-like mRNA interferase family)